MAGFANPSHILSTSVNRPTSNRLNHGTMATVSVVKHGDHVPIASIINLGADLSATILEFECALVLYQYID